MQTNFTAEQLQDPAIREAESILRKCVHCGFCTATCPTYVLLGDELDSPRGRIYLMKDMLENNRQPSETVVKHIDRCLSCLSCMTTCPSGVHYMHLVDHARAYIEQNYKRPPTDRLYRAALAAILPYRNRFRMALRLAPLGQVFQPVFRRIKVLRPLAAMLALAPKTISPKTVSPTATVPNTADRPKGRVILLQGCAEPVLKPEIQAAANRLLARAGYAVHYLRDEGCCGALVHHMGKEAASLNAARHNVDRWCDEMARNDISAILVTASGCGTTIKDYGHMLRNDPSYAEKAARVSALAKDISEFLSEITLPPTTLSKNVTVAYHAACSLQHGQQIKTAPMQLLQAAGFTVKTPKDAHLCCGSAGTYNILQPDIANQLGERKAETLKALRPDVIAAGNIGCIMQIANKAQIPVVHSIELLDWATGGPCPEALSSLN